MSRNKTLRYDTSAPLLDVYYQDRLVGHLGQQGADTWFRYTEAATSAEEPSAHQLSVRLPVRPEVYGHEATLAFFDNLLLESDTRAALASAAQRDQRDVPGLLGQVGSECAGAVSLWPHGTLPPAAGRYRPYSRAQLGELFDEAHGEQLTRAQLESRQSMSGVQDKLVFRRREGSYDLPLEGAPGNVILKRPSRRYPGLVENEYVCQRLIAALELGAAEARALTGGLYLLESLRYDRRLDDAGDIRRVHQEDFCQATGRLPTAKYQHSRGPRLADLAQILRRYSVHAADDLSRLIRITVVNVCVGNMDAHAKNFSLLYEEEGLRLAPFYDVVSTLVYPALTPAYSMSVGSASRPHELNAHAIERLARDLALTPAAVRLAVDEVTAAIEAMWPDVLAAAVQTTGEAAIYRRLDEVINAERERIRAAAVKTSAPRPASRRR